MHPLVVGKTLRPLSDRLRVSREKLAFLVDTTAAPVTAIAIVTTWVAAERGTIRDTFAGLGLQASAIAALAGSLPYCFYPVLVLVFAALVIVLGQDFGPMLHAEWRASTQGYLSNPDIADELVSAAADSEPAGTRTLVVSAWLPILVLFSLVAGGLWWSGWHEIAAQAATGSATSPSLSGSSFLDILEHAHPLRVLLFSSFLASLFAVALAVWSGSLPLQEGLHAWVSGFQRMVPAGLILVLSWSFQRICDADHLNTAGFLMEIGQPRVTVEWVPLVAFLVVGLTSFIVGSTWAALPLALPLFLSLTHELLRDLGEAGPMHPMLLATIGAVIGGTVLGRHCSPISETSIISSASSACSHLDHVFTQLPYALTVAGVTVVFGYVPVAYGYSPVVLLPLCTAVLFVILQFGGRLVVAPKGTATPVGAPMPEEAAAHPPAAKVPSHPHAA
jgi:Na+/H+ antiporter NhaC